LVSIIIPIHNEGNQIYFNVSKVRSILAQHEINAQIVLIDDGSNDHSWQEMQRLSNDYDNILILQLSRNFGKEAALCAGLEKASGDACLILDADLQHPPELIPEMVRLWREEGFDVVEGVKADRGKESKLGKLMALTFYKLFNKVSGINLDSASDFKLLDKKVVDAWKTMNESMTFFRGMCAWMGYKRIQVPFEVQERRDGSSKWCFTSLMKLAVQSITSFTSFPLHLVTFLGVGLLFVDVVLLIETLYMKFSGRAFSGFTTVIILQLGIGSCIMISLGVIGIYISKIYDEVKHRPRYLISRIKGNER
jgi:polyisoprenyl-phosphate glycosyltransferase